MEVSGPSVRNCFHLAKFREERREGSGKALFRQALKLDPKALHVAEALGGSPHYRRVWDTSRKAKDKLANSRQRPREWSGKLDLPETDLKVRQMDAYLVAVGPTHTYFLDNSQKLLATFPSQMIFPGGESESYPVPERTVDLWTNPNQLLTADAHHILLEGGYVVYGLNPFTGQTWSWYSGGDRWPQDVTYLDASGRYAVHEGVLAVTLCDADSGEVLWQCYPRGGDSQMHILKLDADELWVLASYTGRVWSYDLKRRKLLWERWHHQVIP